MKFESLRQRQVAFSECAHLAIALRHLLAYSVPPIAGRQRAGSAPCYNVYRNAVTDAITPQTISDDNRHRHELHTYPSLNAKTNTIR
jgi:hypothetical protein